MRRGKDGVAGIMDARQPCTGQPSQDEPDPGLASDGGRLDWSGDQADRAMMAHRFEVRSPIIKAYSALTALAD
jgi:hypothetical protein